MKVISVLHFPEFGGPHNQMLRLNGPLSERGVYSLTVLPEGAGAERLRAGNVPVEIMQLGRVRAVKDLGLQLRMAARFPVDMWQLVRLLRREKPDVVVLSGLMNPHGAIAARLLGIPVMWQLLDTRPPLFLRRIMMWPIRLLSDSIMPVGYQVAKAHPGAESFGERMVVFYPPVDTQLFQPGRTYEEALRKELNLSPDDRLVGSIGNINPQKGHEFFIEAAAIVRRTHPGAKFVVAGHIYPNHTDYYESLLSQANALGLIPGKDIFFLGSRSDVPNILRSLDVFALASVPNSEGTPTVILEAMACGIPVVATNVGSVSEVVLEGQTGFVVEPLRSERMAERLLELLKNPAMRHEFGEMARTRVVSDFSLDACVDGHMRAFEAAIKHRRGSGRTR